LENVGKIEKSEFEDEPYKWRWYPQKIKILEKGNEELQR